ncbi:MAG: hypothetical protein NW214_16065 [Pseudanabaenaceae cyanobacterium bins.39]|nr:hypothetical protein [Pseudanabaenaceae cyanobacterium bins.39]
MTVTQQKVYLITEPQRDALLAYLQERPYKEVASGIDFLLNATTAMLSVNPETEQPSVTPDTTETSDQEQPSQSE